MKKNPQASKLLLRISAALAGGILIFVLVIGLGTLGFRTIYGGRIFPGIYLGQVNLSGQPPEEAASLIEDTFSFPQQGRISLQYDDLSWDVSPAELGMFFSPNFNAEVAFNTGRTGGIAERIAAQIQILRRGVILAPQFVLDEKTSTDILTEIAAELNQPAVEASIRLEGLNVLVQPGQIGRDLDIPGSLEVIRMQLQTLQNGSLPLIVTETYPEILDVTAQAEFARLILSQPLVLRIPEGRENDPGPWSLSPERLVEMMVIERITTPEGQDFRIALDSEQLRDYLENRAVNIDRKPQNAQMYFDDETRELVLIEGEKTGLTLDINQSIIKIQEELLAGAHDIGLVVEKTLPAITSETTAAELGITELVSSQTTYLLWIG